MNLCYSDERGNVYDLEAYPAFRSGRRLVTLTEDQLIPMPYGSYLFTLPGRYPVEWMTGEGKPKTIRKGPGGEKLQAVSIHGASAYLRTYLPAYTRGNDAPHLPLWAYGGAAMIGDEFYTPAMRIDDDVRSDPEIHENHQEFEEAAEGMSERYAGNRLVSQLYRCSTEYSCLCARNFFLGRHEAPLPTSPACNSRCAGCLSHQEGSSGFSSSQFRLDFKPSVEEISQVMIEHFASVPQGVASFGQGCEGEPLLRAEDLAQSIASARETTDKGTINCNTNGSRPDGLKKMIEAGLDSVRISLNSPTEKYYNRYYKPQGYSFDDVLRSVDRALEAGIFVSINLFFFPGFTDSDSEVESLVSFLNRFPVNMIQTRNMNMDPDLYLDVLQCEDEPAIGIRELVELLRRDFPQVRLGYYNPSVK